MAISPNLGRHIFRLSKASPRLRKDLEFPDLQNPLDSSPKRRWKQSHAPPEITAAATIPANVIAGESSYTTCAKTLGGLRSAKAPWFRLEKTPENRLIWPPKFRPSPMPRRHFFPSNWPSTPVPKESEDAGEQNPIDPLPNNCRKRRAQQF